MSAATLTDKAVRLLAEGNLEPQPLPATVFTVGGDHGTYTTVVSATVQVCTCPSRTRCSHIEAAVQWVNADDSERGLMEATLERRKLADAEKAEDIFARLEAGR